ncbi:hypothetical protein OESDEN_14604 [Oesophagostomum dentatum]|uniref:D-glucuronyl C5-epimerase beta-sandwich domain-containing protein n=1 Tax=Oesophagostomum dentatum TaxID=61180 RepID=A0A0B1SR73_OESDE|nr:hypothetical protein OESDEN_14604 [Oesophagostomum dentatum]
MSCDLIITKRSQGVPMSTQWSPTPYYYPIQIAQYGLQHYSRMLGALHNAGCYVFLDSSPRLHVLSFDWFPVENASFTILVRVIETNMLVLLNYVPTHDPRCVWNDSISFAGLEQISFSYSLGELRNQWYSVTRDALVDTARALSSMNMIKKKDANVILHPGAHFLLIQPAVHQKCFIVAHGLLLGDVKLVSLGFRGLVAVRQRIEQSENAHRKSFLTAADWLVSNQEENGGWSVPVERSIADRRLVLPAGWYSAMAQVCWDRKFGSFRYC